LRTISPIDWVTIQSSVRRTKRAIVVHEAPRTLGIGSEIAAKLHEDLFYVMESPVMRVTGYDMPYPPARVEGEYLPSVDRILDTVDQSLAY
ncbi:MAG TPA: transketolase C-terminal domain-containing protein, partial [Arachnia sp.]|nr:transketolase C-terminal domain-containing protein [Arachnia sp.]